jgi:hypothetical protein
MEKRLSHEATPSVQKESKEIDLTMDDLTEDRLNAIFAAHDMEEVQFENDGDTEHYAEDMAKREIGQIKNLAKTMAEKELLFGITGVERSDYLAIADKIITAKERAMGAIWRGELVRLLKNNKSRQTFIDNAAKGIYDEIERVISEKMAQDGSTH